MKKIDVFYTEKMVAEDIGSASPSMFKPRSAVESWRALPVQIEVHDFPPVTQEQFQLSHTAEYVDGIFDLSEPNGFDDYSADIRDTLPYTTGAMLAAARKALETGTVAVAPCSGFHHAGRDRGEGFCTFNGLTVTAQVLKAEGLVENVGILDFDCHFGNGTDEIIKTLGLGDWIYHYTAGQYFYSNFQTAAFLDMIPKEIKRMRDFGCNIILYQAGADQHENDPYGGWLSSEALLQRDRIVFEECKRHGIPVAWNLAGGYQNPFRKVLDIHDETMMQCWNVYGNPNT
jgi:acetoin utilization deacetylase AcuC-like enzyme